MNENYNVGDRIQNVSPDTKKGRNYLAYGVITEVWGGTVRVQYDNGNSGESTNPRRYYKIIGRGNDNNAPRSTSNTMNTIKNFVRALTLSKEEKLLQKYGLKTECGEYTPQARDIVIAKLCADNEAHLVAIATSYDQELKDEKGN